MMMKGIHRASMMVAALGLLPGALRAQSNALDQGHYAVDGQASLTSSGGEGVTDRRTTVAVSPSMLYFVSQGVAVGGSLQLGYSTAGETSTSTYSVGPQAVIYFGKESAVHPFVSAQAGIGRLSTKGPSATGDGTQHISLTHFVGSAGLLDLLTPSVGIHGQLFYARDSYHDDRDGYSDSFGVAFGFSIFLGG